MTVLICTTENSGIDRYSQELARLLPVTVVRTGRYNLELDGRWLVDKLKTLDQTVHYTNQHFGRISLRAGLPAIVTVHDLERISFPFSPQNVLEEANLKTDVIAIRQAEHVIAVSENTKKDLIDLLKVPEEKISVVYNGVNHGLFKPGGQSVYPFPYLLYVGSERLRKNLPRLLEAFARLKNSPGLADIKLVKVGSPGRSGTFRQATLNKVKELGLEDEVIFVENVADELLPAYYASARAVVYPSLYEGFGLPVLEAMACGSPVITSNLSSLPEVAGDSALLVDPYDVGDIFRAMLRLLNDEGLRTELSIKGIERSRFFSWEKTARQTMDVYCRVEETIERPADGSTSAPPEECRCCPQQGW